MGQRNAMPDLRRLGVYPRHYCTVWLASDSPVPLVLSASNRQGHGLEGLGGDVVVGQHEEGTRGGQGGQAQPDPAEGAYYRRPYAVANITHGTVTMLCADNAASAYAQVRVHENDVMWHTTRIKPGQTHTHDAHGHCIPKVYHVNKRGKYSAR